MAQTVKNLPEIQTWVRSLGWEDPLEKERNGYPILYSYLGNSMDRGAWWATVHRVTKSRTQLSDLDFTLTFWPAGRFNQSILKEINPEYSLEGLILNLKLQYLMGRANSLEKTLMLGKIEGRRRRGQQRVGWMGSSNQWTWIWASSESWWWQGSLECWTIAHQVPLSTSMAFSRQEYWSELALPPPGDLPDPGLEPTSHISCIGRWILTTSTT